MYLVMDDREEYEERNTTALFPLVDSSKQNEIILCWEFVPNVRRRNLTTWTS